MDLVVYALCKKKAKQYTDAAIGNLPKGVVYKGSVNYYADLPNNAELGECYTVLYKGTSGTEISGAEYVWGLNTATSTQEWIKIGEEVDLTDYVKNTDYADTANAGIVKTGYGLLLDNNKKTFAETYSVERYASASANIFIGKGTLENALTGKNLETANNKITSISSSSTDTQYASALATYTYVNNIVGDINTILDDINRWGNLRWNEKL